MTLSRHLARPMLASMFVFGGLNSLRNASALAPKAKPITDRIAPLLADVAPQLPIPTNPETYVKINGAVQLVGGLLLATGHFPRFTALTLAGALAPTTLTRHPFWQESDPTAKSNQFLHFVKNVSLIGGLLMASLDANPHKKFLVIRAKDKVKEIAPTG